MRFIFNVLSGKFDAVSSSPSDVGITFPLAASLGGTGVSNGVSASLTLPNLAITIAGGVAGGTYTLPSTAGGGAFALLATANVFTAEQSITVPTSTNTGLILQSTDNSTTKDLFLVKSSTGVVRSQMTKDGKFFIGTTGVPNPEEYLFQTISNNASGVTVSFTNNASSGNQYARINFGVRTQAWLMQVDMGAGAWWTIKDNTNNFIPLQLGINSSSRLYVNHTVYGSYIQNYKDLPAFAVFGHTTQTLPVGLYVDNTAATNAIRNVLQLETRSTGTAANGLGAGLLFSIETATAATIQSAGLISTSWVDATNASRKAKMSLSAYDTAARLGIEIEASGTVAKLGFFGAPTVVQPAGANQAALTNSTGGTYNGTLVDVGVVFSQAAINDNFTDLFTLLTEIRTALVNTGLIKGSA